MSRRVAIVGLGPSHDDVPLDWETWGLAWDHWAFRYDRILEMHDRSLWAKRPVAGLLHHAGAEYIERINDIGKPCYMQRTYPDVPHSVAYPLADVIAEVGDYFGSSASYWLALAILEGVDEIGLWGIDLLDPDDSYRHQRENLEYLIGFARGRGIKVRISEGSTLLTFRPDDHFNGAAVTYDTRYGWLCKEKTNGLQQLR